MKYFFIKVPLLCSVTLALSFGSQVALAGILDGVGSRETIRPGDTVESWTLTNGATLNVIAGGETNQIKADSGSFVNIQGGTINASTDDGVRINESTAIIDESTITSTSNFGLIVTERATSSGPSLATVTNSQISGVGRGVSVALAEVILSGTQVTGTDAGGSTFFDGGMGLGLFGAKATVTNGSSIVGDRHGVLISPEGGNTPVEGTISSLTVDNSRIEGKQGSAITVGSFNDNRPSIATIVVQNNSTLTGGNGIILEVANNSTVDFSVDNSHLIGDVLVAQGSHTNVTLQNNASLTGQLTNIENLAINSNARWNMVDSANVGALSLGGGSVNFGDGSSFRTLTVGSLTGSGNFAMNVDFGRNQNDFLNVAGNASGNHTLSIGSTGTDPLTDTNLHMVHADAGDANFSLLGGPVDLGTYSYDLVKQGDNDWFLDASTRTVSPGTRSVLALFNTAPTVWYGELTSLRTRMGELRLNGSQSGGWMRTYGNKFNVADASGFGYQQTQQGVTLGADGKLPMGDGQWLLGVMAGQSKSDLNLDRGTTGKTDSYYAGIYTTWLDSETGYYFDGVLKFNRFQNNSKVNLSDGTRAKGDYDNSGVGTSLEFGRHIKLDDGYFIEPYTQLSGVVIQGKNYELDNDMRAEGDRTRSLLGKVGTTVGRNFDLGQGKFVQPYVRVAVAHEFAKNNEVQVNNNVFNNDLSGSRGELGTGIAVSLSENIQLHADFEYSNGENIEQPWGANVGARYSW